MKNGYLHFDVLVIGTGVSGLTSAIKLAEKNLRVCVVTRAKDPKESNTYWAQGGIIYLDNEKEEIVEDIFKASSNTSYLPAAKTLANKSGAILQEMLIEKAKTQFERSLEGELMFTKEAAHSRPRILYKGDFTGKEIEISLLNYLNDKKRFPEVTILTSHTAIDLLTPLHHGTLLQQRYEETRVVGAYVFDQEIKKVIKILSKITILATGGIGAIYLHHTNSEGARGDGHAMAKRAGAILIDMEFIQFHPTTFFQGSSHRRFLISEAVRGEGGILSNAAGERFMGRYHADLELAPRDVVARAIVAEMILTKQDCVYLDITHKGADWVQERFPTIFKHCLENGIDITKEKIPVVPAAHYTCGGVKTDLVGQTNLKGLYAVGEVACTGLHGANRLASTSLLEGLTFGHLAAEDIAQKIKNFDEVKYESIKDWEQGAWPSEPALIEQDHLALKHTMWNYVGLTRNSQRLARAEAMLRELGIEIQKFYKNAELRDELIGLRNAVEVGQMVLAASRRNQKSIGCFFRQD